MNYLHVLDSGAFSWWTKRRKSQVGKAKWEMYSMKPGSDFRTYVDAYAKFCKKYRDCYDRCVNCDVIGNAAMSWKVLKYLEKEHGLNPMPVIHTLTPLSWLEKHLDAGYDYIGIGGAARSKRNYYTSVDRMFNVICRTKDRLPICKVHGFAATTHEQIIRYPWFTVDSVTWKKMAYYGQILVPRRRNGEFDFKRPYKLFFVDALSKYQKRPGEQNGRHWDHLSNGERQRIRWWLKRINVSLGNQHIHEKEKAKDAATDFGKNINPEGYTVIEVGVRNSSQERVAANIKYFLELQKHVPRWPWAFQYGEPLRTFDESLLKGVSDE